MRQPPRALVQPLSQPRVALYEDAVGEVFFAEHFPLSAAFLRGTEVPVALNNLVKSFHKLHSQSCSNVERDMAVHEPSAGVVGPEGENKVAAGRQRRCVASDRVRCLQARNVACPGSVFLLVQHPKVVTVQVDGMG